MYTTHQTYGDYSRIRRFREIKKGNFIYLAEVENRRIGGKLVQKHLRYIGKEVDDKPLHTGSVARSSVDVEDVSVESAAFQ